MDRFKELASFVRVADRGSFAAAASEEDVTPVVIGRRMDALEKRLGTKLLHRSTRRLTLTAPILNAARCVMFTVEGGDKAASLAAVLEGPRDPHRYPSQLIAPVEGELLWLVDRAAAARLTLKPEDPSSSRSPA